MEAKTIKREAAAEHSSSLNIMTQEKLIKEGCYFKCKEQGHISSNCPSDPPKEGINLNTQLKELEQRQEDLGNK